MEIVAAIALIVTQITVVTWMVHTQREQVANDPRRFIIR